MGDWRLVGFSWPCSTILEIVWAFSVFWSLPKHSLPRSGGNAFTTPHSSTWVDLSWIRFVIVLDSCCIRKRLSRVYKGQTGFKFRGLRFRVFGCFVFDRCFVFEIWVLRSSFLSASFSKLPWLTKFAYFTSISGHRVAPKENSLKKISRSKFLQSSFIFVRYLLKDVYRKIMSEIHFVDKTRYEDLTETGF